jgi:hypothetical protein
MSLIQYTITNQSSVSKIFSYYSESIEYNITVDGFDTVVFTGDDTPPPTLVTTGVSEDIFVSDAYIPPSGSAWLWNNGDKVQYIKISNTPVTGSSITPIVNRAGWIEFSMVEAKNKLGNFIYPTSPNTVQLERYIIDNTNKKPSYSTLVINSNSVESSEAVIANSSSVSTGFSYFDQQFNINQDCNPIVNNATEPRLNPWLQDVDYSVNAITPINFNQLINFTATRATVPQSNYTQIGFAHSRYEGSSTTRDQINKYSPSGSSDSINKFIYSDDSPPAFLINKGKGPSLGKIPNIELNNAYIAYFNKVIDPYPTLNNKVAYYVKYLIDESGTILDPNLSNINFSIFKDTFQLRDFDSKPTNVNIAISSIDESKELLGLTSGLSSVYKIGQYPVPILYSQISSLDHTNEIALSGSKFLSALGPGSFISYYDISILAIQDSASVASTPSSYIPLSIPELEWDPEDITPPTPADPPNFPSAIPTSSIDGNYKILFPLDINGTPPSTSGGSLSDTYIIQGSFQFTTSAIPCEYAGSVGDKNYLKNFLDRNVYGKTNILRIDLTQFRKQPNSLSYVNSNEGLKVNNVKLTITTNPGATNQIVYSTLDLEQFPSNPSYGQQWGLSPSGIFLSPNSLYIEDLIINKLKNSDNVRNIQARTSAAPLIGGGWATSSGNVFGFGAIPVKYDWEIDFEISNLFQETGLYLESQGSILSSQDNDKHGPPLFRKPSDVFLFFGANGEPNNNQQWRRTFTPGYSTGINTKPILKLDIISPLSAQASINNAQGPFWRRFGNTDNELFMSSSVLNQAYGKSFVQAKLPYNGNINTDFPLTVEPGFIEFDPVTDFWKLEIGDEIRFENDENLVFTIVKKEGEEEGVFPPKNSNSNLPEDKLRIVVFPPFTEKSPSNFDFFVVRRYKENKNFIILNQQMPYGFSYGNGTIDYSGEDVVAGVEPVTRASSPGILLPEYRIDKFNTNPDLVLKELIEKNII